MKVEVVYCGEQQLCFPLEVADDATVEQAIRQSGVLDRYPQWDLATLTIGIFSKRTTLQARLAPGDRVEIYRPLLIDPKQARRLRAKERSIQQK